MITAFLAEQAPKKRLPARELNAPVDEGVGKSALLEETLPGMRLVSHFEVTQFFVAGNYNHQFWLDSSSATRFLTDRTPQSEYSQRDVEADAGELDAFEKENSDRIILLARKYAAKVKLSDEAQARLEIATERVRKLIPAVTVVEFEQLASKLRKIDELAAEDRAIRTFLEGKTKKRG